ncbi:MAG TPA: hypothetical protein VEC35_25220 [Noviherbaspirillum sp.]|nr:hypothetical protein [Noviherbaspirillum sp.]
MGTYQAPTKEQVREYLKRRFGSSGPVPSISEIRSALGWDNRPVSTNTSACQGDAPSEREDSTA